MKIEVPNADIVDKITVLRLKEANITDTVKSRNISRELKGLLPLLLELNLTEEDELYKRLLYVNSKIWEAEDKLHEKESQREFNEEFIFYARSAYQFNDQRSQLKKEINLITDSYLLEEKSHN